MANRLIPVGVLQSAIVFSSIIAAAPAMAQSSNQGDASAQPALLGPATPQSGSADLSCGTDPAGLGFWDADRIEETLSLDEGRQQARFEALKTASQRAIQYLDESCPKNNPVTPTGRLEAMERRLSAMLEAVRTVQPALDDFYATLTDEQKARLASIATDDGDRERQGRGRQRRRGRHFIRIPVPFVRLF